MIPTLAPSTTITHPIATGWVIDISDAAQAQFDAWGLQSMYWLNLFVYANQARIEQKVNCVTIQFQNWFVFTICSNPQERTITIELEQVLSEP